MRIYITHCSAKKNDQYKNKQIEVTPDILYTSTKIQRFMRECKIYGAKWAIFSDLYGVWFPNEKHVWYDKSPDEISESDFMKLLEGFDKKLKDFDEIFFYHNPSRFHPRYRQLVERSQLKNRITLFSHVYEIS